MSSDGSLPLLVADIGGTSTRIAIVEGETLGTVAVFPTPDGDPMLLLQACLERHGVRKVRGCALAAAGLVRGRGKNASVRLTNRDTTLSAARVARTLGCPVAIHNDLAALAAAVPVLRAGSDWQALDGVRVPVLGTKLVIAIGTGFGAALVTARREVIATEAGQALWPLIGEARMRIEDLLSGRVFTDRHAGFDGAAGLVQAAQAGAAPALAAMQEWASLLGRAAANLVLTTGAWSGVYFAGGLFTALAPALDAATLRAAMTAHPVFAQELARVPLVHIREVHATLRGLTALARRMKPRR